MSGLDAAAILALANDLKSAKIACGAADNPALTALCTAEASAFATFVKKAEVDPTALPTPLTAPPGGGPVTGKGKLT